MKQRLLFTFALFVTFFIGAAFSYTLLGSQVHRCEADKARLATDLNRAVVRGVAIETQLNLCKGEKK